MGGAEPNPMVGSEMKQSKRKLHSASFYVSSFPCFLVSRVFMQNAKLHAGEKSGIVMASVH